MWRKITLTLIFAIIAIAAFTGWRFFTANTSFNEKARYLFVYTNHATYQDVLQTLKDSQLVNNPGAFDFLAHRMDLERKIKPGRYEIKKGMSLFDIARILRNGRQAPVHLVITKLRTKEELAALVGKKFESDSSSMKQYLDNPDSLKQYNLDTNSVMAAVFPDTYIYFWNTGPSVIFKKFFAKYETVWTSERKQLAMQHGLSPTEAYILASIVEEETNASDEKGNMASVYLNRYKKGMRLQADPTIKFALKDFSLKRIYEKYLTVQSPYNTYQNTGLPPGPICTPSLSTLDAVLHSPSTNYLYFVAKSDFSGRHVFNENYEEHMKYAKEFQEALNAREQKNKDSVTQ